MKKFFEGIKDFLYDSVDYIIVLSIIVVVVIIIGWRIDLLFVNDPLSEISNDVQNNMQIVDSNIENEPILEDVEKENLGDGDENHIDQISDKDEEAPTNENPDNGDNTMEQATIVKISIPAGSLPSKIGSILEDKGLIISKDEFVMKSQELKLDTKLKSGDFDIPTNNSVEDIIYIISK